MKTLWLVCTIVLVSYTKDCQCQGFVLDIMNDSFSSPWDIAKNTYFYVNGNTTDLRVETEHPSSTMESYPLPPSFWDKLEPSLDGDESLLGLWAFIGQNAFGFPDPTITFKLNAQLLVVKELVITYYLYGDSRIQISANGRNVTSDTDNCKTTNTTEMVKESHNTTTDCDWGNRKWSKTTVSLTNCTQENVESCNGVNQFTLTFNYTDTTDNFTATGGFIFLDKIVAVPYIPPTPSTTPRTTTTTRPKTTTAGGKETDESTTGSFANSLTPLFFLVILFSIITLPLKIID